MVANILKTNLFAMEVTNICLKGMLSIQVIFPVGWIRYTGYIVIQRAHFNIYVGLHALHSSDLGKPIFSRQKKAGAEAPAIHNHQVEVLPIIIVQK